MTQDAVRRAPDARKRSQLRAMNASTPESLDRRLQEIRDLGLEGNVVELDTYGYTVVPPERVAPLDFVERVRDRVL